MTVESRDHMCSRRNVSLAAVAMSVATSLPIPASASPDDRRASRKKDNPSGETINTSTITAKDGTELYYNDWGKGPPVVFSHGWPQSADAFEDQMFFLASRGFRCIALDRRGHGRSSQAVAGNDFDTYAGDLLELVEKLDLKDAAHVGHSSGGGEVSRYIGRHGTKRVAKAVLISNPAPYAEDGSQPGRSSVGAIRSDPRRRRLRPLAVLQRFELALLWLQPAGSEDFGRRPGVCPAAYFSVKAFSETDFTGDLKRFDVPTLVLHGDDDQIVPLADSALLSSKIIKDAKLVIYKGAPHGMCTTEKDRVNAELLSFIKG